MVTFRYCIYLGVIFCFKYYDFFISNLNHVFQANFNLKNILLSLGISFFTFRQLSYIVDSYTGKIKDGGVSVRWICLICYIFSTACGRADCFAWWNDFLFQDTSAKKVNIENLDRGIMMFVLGLFKKVLVADVFGEMVTWGFGISILQHLWIWF